MSEEDKKTVPQTKKEKIRAIIKETVETVVFVTVAVILIRFFLGELRWIPSGSMIPTLIEKDKIFVEKVTGFYREPKRGEVMVFYPPSTELKNTVGDVFKRLIGIMCKDIAYIKRIVGMPGDQFEIKLDQSGNYRVYINGEAIEEDYISSTDNWIPCMEGMQCGPMVIPEGHYFMMGDNRGNSQDSRFWGLLSEDRLIGRAVVIFWPLKRIQTLETPKYQELQPSR